MMLGNSKGNNRKIELKIGAYFPIFWLVLVGRFYICPKYIKILFA